MPPTNDSGFDVAGRGWTPGDVVGRYRLLTRIAVGGMAEIWLALQQGMKGFERVVVVKRISEGLSADPTFVEMFLDEARIAAQLNHPNIVQIYDLGEHEGAYYIAMEYLHGEDLASIMRAAIGARSPLSPAFAARIVASAAEGLASAHARVGLDGKPLNVVHRDVSPQNIFITYDGIVKVLDFGVAKARNRASVTSGGQVKGKFSYMSPEQARGGEVDPRTDVWALGVVLFETATATRLFEGRDDQMAVREAVLRGDVPSARARNPVVPAELDAIISCALERELDLRTPTAAALQRDLEAWLRKRADAPNTQALSAAMHELFGDRILKKSQLIESVREGSVRLAQLPVVLKPPTERSMPEGPISRSLKSGSGKVALTIAALAVVGAAVFLGLNPHALDAPAPVIAPEAPPAPEPEEDEAPDVAESPEVKAAVPAAATARAPVRKRAAKGRLSLETTPWTQVWFQGRNLGDTPLLEKTLPAGKQSLKLLNPDKGIKQVIEVEIQPGQTTVLKVKL